MSFIDVVTLMGVVFAVIAAVVGGFWAISRTIATLFDGVHRRIDEVAEKEAEHHLEITTQITRLSTLQTMDARGDHG